MRAAFIGLLAFSTCADAIPITGTAIHRGGSLNVEIEGPDLSFTEGSGIPSTAPLSSCPPAPQTCQLNVTFPIPPLINFFWNLTYTGIEISGNPAEANGMVDGFLTVSTDPFVFENLNVTVPITVSGELIGFQEGQTSPFAYLVIEGTGSAVVTPWIGGVPGFVGSVEATFSGTATPIPEPGSLFLAGLGVLTILGRRLVGRT